MTEDPGHKHYPLIEVHKEAMASLVGLYMQDGDFREAVRAAKDDDSRLQAVLDEYGYVKELSDKELEAVLDFSRHTLRKGWSDEQLIDELIGHTDDTGLRHLNG